MNTAIVIPARYASTRFPGKPLVELLRKPMILWVAEICEQVVDKKNVYIATEDTRIQNVVESAGYTAIMTSETALTGTDRIAEAARTIDASIIINIQGDEPLLNPDDIQKVIQAKQKYPDDIINAYCPLSSEEDPDNVNIPKVVFTEDKRMIYMSRKAIPGSKSKKNTPAQYYKQVCIYGFSKNDLERYADYGRKSIVEEYEDIEILRFLEWDSTIRMIETNPGSLAVDVTEDIPPVEYALKRKHNL